jgi:Protein of unknown function (DUF2735)
MTTSIAGGSARIYEFPPRGRFAPTGRDESEARATLEAQPLVKAASGSGWYHDAAIAEAEHSRGK